MKTPYAIEVIEATPQQIEQRRLEQDREEQSTRDPTPAALRARRS